MTIPAATDPLARARILARLLDTAGRVPGTRIRFGLDPVLGLIPGLGDVAGAVLSGYFVLVGARLGASRLVILRMLGNIAIDTIVGSVPLFGDAFDVAWKSNVRNLVLLERIVQRSDGRATRSYLPASRAVVGAVLLGLALIAGAGILVAFFMIRFLVHHIH